VKRTLLLLTAILSLASHASAAKPPNIVLIISDDQSWTDYSFMGHEAIETPNIDRLAKQSRLFKRGYVPSSLCCPSLASMITGLYPHQTKITGNEPPMPPGGRNSEQYRKQVQECVSFIDDLPTLPRLLAKRGYLSHQSGKWWQGHYSRGGFTHGMTHGDPKRGGRHGDVGLKIGREGMDEIFDFIEDAGDKPFFVWYAPFLPHTPHNPPKRLLDKYAKKTESKFIARYWAMCEWFDETCGQLLDHLDEKKLADDTIVLYVTDNGWIQRADNGRYAPRSKRSQYDGGLRTPIMVRWPGKVKPEDRPELANSIDLAPTILKACGLAPTKEMQGIDLLDDTALAKRKSTYGAIYLHNAVDIHKPSANLTYRWLINGDWKLILPHKENVTTKAKHRDTGETELYNLAKDPHERNNLAKARQDRTKRLAKQLNELLPK
tara:strand:+ start:199 stop:1500 length:1302 start_codon:yes stop_codon:yes gene_type:complete